MPNPRDVDIIESNQLPITLPVARDEGSSGKDQIRHNGAVSWLGSGCGGLNPQENQLFAVQKGASACMASRKCLIVEGRQLLV